jgi:NADH-quinone oxidoreductase subunit G
MHQGNGGAPEFVPAERLGNSSVASVDLNPAANEPVVAAIYQLDGTVRRATSLQLTADGQAAGSLSAQEALA